MQNFLTISSWCAEPLCFKPLTEPSFETVHRESVRGCTHPYSMVHTRTCRSSLIRMFCVFTLPVNALSCTLPFMRMGVIPNFYVCSCLRLVK